MDLLKKLTPYLPYGLQVYHEAGTILTMDAAGSAGSTLSIIDVPEFAKPLVRPLDFTKEIQHDGVKLEMFHFLRNKYHSIYPKKNNIMPLRNWVDKAQQPKGYDLIPHWIFQDLIKHHFDVFGMIESGEALNLNDYQ